MGDLRSGPLRRGRKRLTARDRAEYAFVTARDGECITPVVDPAADACEGPAERQHVRPGPGATRLTDRRWMVLLCRHHHHDGWGTSKHGLKLQRDYLEERANG